MEEAIEMDFTGVVSGIFERYYIQRVPNALGGPGNTSK